MCHTRNRFKYAKRRCQNACDRIKRDKLVQAALSGDCNLFEELGKIKGRKNNHSASKIDGISGDVKIAEHFKEIYKDLYNKTGSDQPLRNLRNEVNTKCSANDMNVIDKVTPCLIDKIISNRLKPGKTDVDADITTDCLKNAPYELSCHISNFLKACLMHGYISDNLLTCAIILLVKSRPAKLPSYDGSLPLFETPCREKQPFSQHLNPGINPTSEWELTRKQKSPYTRSKSPYKSILF